MAMLPDKNAAEHLRVAEKKEQSRLNTFSLCDSRNYLFCIPMVPERKRENCHWDWHFVPGGKSRSGGKRSVGEEGIACFRSLQQVTARARQRIAIEFARTASVTRDQL